MTEKNTVNEEERMRLINQKQRNTCRLTQNVLVETMPYNKWISISELSETLWVDSRRVKQLLGYMATRNFWNVRKHSDKKDFYMLIQ